MTPLTTNLEDKFPDKEALGNPVYRCKRQTRDRKGPHYGNGIFVHTHICNANEELKTLSLICSYFQ